MIRIVDDVLVVKECIVEANEWTGTEIGIGMKGWDRKGGQGVGDWGGFTCLFREL